MMRCWFNSVTDRPASPETPVRFFVGAILHLDRHASSPPNLSPAHTAVPKPLSPCVPSRPFPEPRCFWAGLPTDPPSHISRKRSRRTLPGHASGCASHRLLGRIPPCRLVITQPRLNSSVSEMPRKKKSIHTKCVSGYLGFCRTVSES